MRTHRLLVVPAACSAALFSLRVAPAVEAVDARILPIEHAPLELAGAEDYRVPVGRLENGVLEVQLDARLALWRPWEGDGPAVPAHVFAPPGVPAKVPGPLIRVAAGTSVHVGIRNTLSTPLIVRGLRDRGQHPLPAAVEAAFLGDSLLIAPGSVGEVRFTPTVPGTYLYFGRAVPKPFDRVPPFAPSGNGPDSPFMGVLVVDPPGTSPDPHERIFVLATWKDYAVRPSWDPIIKQQINGRSWPHTERLTQSVGDTVRWRIVNATAGEHPMHLHGFFFSVDAVGDQTQETVYPAGARELAVTHPLAPFGTFRLSWAADEPGNWLFHCHLMEHMSSHQSAANLSDSAAHHGSQLSGRSVLGGLVLGITVHPRDNPPPAATARRRLRLYVGRRPGVFGREPSLGFVLQEGARPPAPDSVRIPGSPIVMTRGEPAEITVFNRTDRAFGVHWHGLELESWADGVPDWSGTPGALSPPIAPGDSFTVRLTPRRAGTFIYHVHSEPGHELAQGLYGPFLVLEPGERLDPEVDHTIVLGSLGADRHAPAAVNGDTVPRPIQLRAGRTHRLRFIQISPEDEKWIALLEGGGRPVTWRQVAKDGATRPAARVRDSAADLAIRVGETYDVLFTPERAGDLTLRVATRYPLGPPAYFRGGRAPDTARVLVRVR